VILPMNGNTKLLHASASLNISDTRQTPKKSVNSVGLDVNHALSQMIAFAGHQKIGSLKHRFAAATGGIVNPRSNPMGTKIVSRVLPGVRFVTIQARVIPVDCLAGN
jgi:hypothetical protein